MVNPKSQVFLFTGAEEYLKDRAVEALKQSVLGTAPLEFDHKVFHGDASSAREILEFTDTLPFSSPKRFVVVKDFEELSQEDRKYILNYIVKPARSACMVIYVGENPGLLRQLTGMPAHVQVRRFDAPDGPDAVSRIKKVASSAHKSITDDAAQTLMELQGANLSILKEEMDKIIAFTQSRETITAEDVEAVVGRSFTGSAFDIISAVDSRDADKALALVRDLALSGKKPQEMIGIISWHFKRLLKAKTMKAGGANEYAISSALKINRRYAGDFFRQFKAINMDQIRSKMEILLQADLDIKNSRFDPALLFETAVVRLCLG